MNQVIKQTERPEKRETPTGVVDNWRAFDEKYMDVQREWTPGDATPSIEVTDDFFRVICKDPNSPDCVSYGGATSKAVDKFPGILIYREKRREAAEVERSLPLDEFHIKKVKQENERKKLAEEQRQLRARK